MVQGLHQFKWMECVTQHSPICENSVSSMTLTSAVGLPHVLKTRCFGLLRNPASCKTRFLFPLLTLLVYLVQQYLVLIRLKKNLETEDLRQALGSLSYFFFLYLNSGALQEDSVQVFSWEINKPFSGKKKKKVQLRPS